MPDKTVDYYLILNVGERMLILHIFTQLYCRIYEGKLIDRSNTCGVFRPGNGCFAHYWQVKIVFFNVLTSFTIINEKKGQKKKKCTGKNRKRGLPAFRCYSS